MTRTTNADGSVTVSLEFPIKAEGETLGHITMRKPTAKDLRKLSLRKLVIELDGDEVLKAVSILSALAPSSLDQLSAPDVAELTTEVRLFFEKSRPIGGTSPQT